MSAPIHIGTSGWSYPHWREAVYPRKLPQRAWLEYYAEHLSSVEINLTFYRLPDGEVFTEWKQAVPLDFVFAVKASRYITHMKKLKEPEEGLARLVEAASHLGGKRGPLLFQLPPRWHVNTKRLEGLLRALPRGCRAAFEFRDPTWLVPEVYELLEAHRAALCIFDMDGRCSPVELTADFTYVRLHGPGPRYLGSYPKQALRTWTTRFSRWTADGIECYCYFDNDQEGHAFHNALALDAMLTGSREQNARA